MTAMGLKEMLIQRGASGTQSLFNQTRWQEGLHSFARWVQSIVLYIGLALPRLSFWMLTTTTISIPSFVYKVLSTNFTLHLNFTSLYNYQFMNVLQG